MSVYKVGEWYQCCCCKPLTCDAFRLYCPGIADPQPDVQVSTDCPCWWLDDDNVCGGSNSGSFPWGSNLGDCHGHGSSWLPAATYYQWEGPSCYCNWPGDEEWTNVFVCLGCGPNPYKAGTPDEWLLIIELDTQSLTNPGGNIAGTWGWAFFPLTTFWVDTNGIINGSGGVVIREDGWDTPSLCSATATFGP